MTRSISTGAERHLTGLFRLGAAGLMTDPQLLEEFAAGDADSAALAFECIVNRHGPMVFQVCTRVLRDTHAAEDAFQATFLVLARKARALRSRELLANWLYGVAHHTSRKARLRALRRRIHEERVARHSSRPLEEAPGDGRQDDLNQVLHEEIKRLPRSYREAVVVCYLEGMSQAQAALRLGQAESTVRGRLARARKLLGQRLVRRGVALSGGLLALDSAANAFAGAPPGLTPQRMARAALHFVNRGKAIDGAVSATAHDIARGVLFNMRFYPLGSLAVVAAAMGIVFSGAQLVMQSTANAKLQQPPAEATHPPDVALASLAPLQDGDRPTARLAQAKKARRKPQGKEQSVEINPDLKKSAPGEIVRAVPLARDCMIMTYLPDWNHGEVDNLGLQNSGARILVDWPAIPADEADLADRRFLIAAYARKFTSNPPDGPIYAFELLEQWRERTSWKALPRHDLEPAATFKFEPGGGWKLFDITPLVRAQAKSGRTSHGIMLRFLSEEATGNDTLSGYDFVSREGAQEWTDRRPLLLVVKKAKE
jgi:RNA polymerase sigma factor (sigma-70 family)